MHDRVESCFVSVAKGCVIDTLKPNGRTAILNETLDMVRRRHPDAEQMSLDAAMVALEERFTSKPVIEISEDVFDEALGCLPPNGWVREVDTESFKSSEHLFAGVTAIYVRIGKRYFTFNDRFYRKHDVLVKKVQDSINSNTQ